MQFTKITPAKRTTFKALWVKKEFAQYNERFRSIRSKAKNKMDKCFMCKGKFSDDEMIGLGCFGGVGNKTLCGECASELLDQKD